MIKFISYAVLLFGLLYSSFNCATPVNALEQFALSDSVGQFTQQKKFKFLQRVISSSGEFVLHKQHLYWHTQSPLQSELLLLAKGIYRRDNASQQYQLITKEQKFNTLLAQLLSGQIMPSDWQVSATEQASCIILIPTHSQVLNLFQQVQLCAQQPEQRTITITDQQNNQTIITMTLQSRALTQNEMDKVKLTQ